MSNSQKTKVLIVDDQEGLRITMAGLLEMEGYEVTAVGNGYDAIEAVKKDTFDIAFLDMKMAGINGVETFKEIKKINSATAVFMMTAYAVESLIEEAIREGAKDIFYKPFDIEKVLNILKKIEKRTSILIIDDDANFLETIRSILEEKGYDVKTVGNGEAAIESLNKYSFDMVFLDVMMPGMDGVEVLKRIKEEIDEARLPLIMMMTGYDINEKVDEALALGAKCCLRKPLEIEDVEENINAQVNEKE